MGIEEEYLLVDPGTGDLVSDQEVQKDVVARVTKDVGSEIGFATPEFLRAQVEIGTGICTSIPQLRSCLGHLRGAVSDAAGRHGLAIVAASTHPTAVARSVKHTKADRYNTLQQDLQEVARRMVICGMHVHVGVEDPEHRIDLLGQVSYFLPHLLVMSTSSPFWEGHDTGLKCYRLSIFNELPRTGLPEHFDSWAEYERHINALVAAGAIEDSSKIWWDIRPHGTFPTLEMRIADICTRMDDGITIAAYYVCLLSMLQRLRRNNQRWRAYSNLLIDENRWRAQRYGADEGLIDFGITALVPYKELLGELVDMIMPDAEAMGCVDEIMHAYTIIERGTSADVQRSVFQEAMAAGDSREQALKKVVDWLIDATVENI